MLLTAIIFEWLCRSQKKIVGWKVIKERDSDNAALNEAINKDEQLMKRLGYNPDNLDEVLQFYEDYRKYVST